MTLALHIIEIELLRNSTEWHICRNVSKLGQHFQTAPDVHIGVYFPLSS